METLVQDLRYGFRMLLQKPAFTAVAVASLALGIGANTTIFSLVDALLLRSLPVAEPERLVTVFTNDEKNPGFLPTSHLNWKDVTTQTGAFERALGYDWTPMSISTGEGEPEVMTGQMVSGNYFEVLGIRPALGRTFLSDEDREGVVQAVAVASDRFWREHLGADPRAVGRTIRLNDHPFTIIGVAPPEFTGTDVGVQPVLWVPMAANPVFRPNPETNWYNQRRGLTIFTVARLKPGVTLSRAEAELTAVSRRLQRDFPVENKGRSFKLVPFAQATINPQLRGGVVAASVLLLTIVGLVLLIACANVANLLLARASARRKEVAVRLSIGAGRGRLIRQLLTESVLLALCGGLFGLLVAWWANRGLMAVLPSLPIGVAAALDLGLDLRILAFTLALSVVTGLLFGLVPALQASKAELVSALKSETAPAVKGGRRLGGRNLLVVAQVALSLIALIGAGLFVRSLGQAQQIDPGYDVSRLLRLSFDLGFRGYDETRGELFARQAVERVAALPGVASATVAQAGPFQGTLLRSVFPEGQEGESSGTLVQVNGVGPRYFETVSVPVVRGRVFEESDRKGAPYVAVINERMAETFWPDQDPVGRRFRFFGDEFTVEVVGVARTVKYNFVGEDPQPYVYIPLAQRWGGNLSLVVRAQGDPQALAAGVEREVRELDKELPLQGAETIEHALSETLWLPRMGASLLGIFGLLALVLAAVGIYGVTSFAVAQRAREIGVRMALGARREDVLAMVLRQGMTVVAVGVAVGLVLAFLAARLIATMLFGISPADPVAFGAMSLLLALVALVANLVPAQRATAVDPVLVLKG